MIKRELNQQTKLFILYDVACVLKRHLEVRMYYVYMTYYDVLCVCVLCVVCVHVPYLFI